MIGKLICKTYTHDISKGFRKILTSFIEGVSACYAVESMLTLFSFDMYT